MRLFDGLPLALFLLAVDAHAQEVDVGAPFGALRLIDEVNAADPDDPHEMLERPEGASRVEDLLGRPARVLAPSMSEAGMVAYRMGVGVGLTPGAAYLLVVEYPDDLPRTIVVLNRGADQIRAFATGIALGDYREQYAYPNPESLRYPQSQTWRRARFLFYLHDRFQGLTAERNADDIRRPHRPEEGFWVAIGQFHQRGNPLEEGAAVGRIQLFEVPEPARLDAAINYPPDDLPRRHIFWREEMNDSSSMCLDRDRATDHDAPDFGDHCNPATDDPVDYLEHKMRLARFLGINTFTKDLMEFGHNQGVDYAGFGGSAYSWQPETTYWAEAVDRATDHGLDILPYYEYEGSLGANAFTETPCAPVDHPDGDAICREAHGPWHQCMNSWRAGVATALCGLKSYGYQKRCRPLGERSNYGGVGWAENRCVDVTDPDAIADVDTLLEATVLSKRERGNFLGVWMRTRVGAWPMSFTDQTLARFAEVVGAPVTRADLRQDMELRQRYYAWWFERRRDFLLHIRRRLREGGLPDASVLLTPYHQEGLPRAARSGVVTDDVVAWEAVNLDERWSWRYGPLDYTAWLEARHFPESLTGLTPPTSEALEAGETEWDHGTPPADPARYAEDEGIALTAPFGRLYTVDDPTLFDEFRGAGGLALIRHYPLNEGDGEGDLEVDRQQRSFGNWPMSGHWGYFVTDVDRAGEHSMLGEARAVAHGDPHWLGYLSSASFNRAFPEITRRFNRAFLALPALPSARLEGASSDPEVVVRLIEVEARGAWVAIVNTSMEAKPGVEITLPEGRAVDLVSGEVIEEARFDLYSGELRALRITATTAPEDAGVDAGAEVDMAVEDTSPPDASAPQDMEPDIALEDAATDAMLEDAPLTIDAALEDATPQPGRDEGAPSTVDASAGADIASTGGGAGDDGCSISGPRGARGGAPLLVALLLSLALGRRRLIGA